jgi:integral membrane protein (TIGR01906 family)
MIRALPTLLFIIWSLSVSVLIIASTVNVFVGSDDLYRWGFNKYQIAARTGINDEQLSEVAKSMAGYLAGSSKSPQLSVSINGQQRLLYNQKELVHLEDVRMIVWLFQLLQMISIAVFIIIGMVLYFRKGTPLLLQGAKIGAAIVIGITGLLVVWSLIDFNSLFYLFHLISFSNDLWILDPTRDYLIMMFPQRFFYDSAIFMVISILVAAIILMIASALLYRIILRSEKSTLNAGAR